MFNPTQYSLDHRNQFQEQAGLGAPMLQYVGGGTASLTVDLFFDTYEQQSDVRTYTNKIYGLLDIDRDTHAPPVCAFTWGTFTFDCVVDSVHGRFTLFLADGTPVRATLTVTLKQAVDIAVAVRRNPTQSADHAKTTTVCRDDTLSAIAATQYRDPTRWRPIADANHIANPRWLSPGQELIIPALPARNAR